MPIYSLIPQDVLFFRDGRPMETSGGHGARWPEPSLIFDALHAALYRAFPEGHCGTWEHRHDFGRSGHRPHNNDRSQRFGALKTVGLFPQTQGSAWLFPAPQDVASCDDSLHLLAPMNESHGQNNLPQPCKYSLGNPCKPSKEAVQPWWSKTAYETYLGGSMPPKKELWCNDDLFTQEWVTGIGIDPERQVQDGEHIYSAEYLRLRPNIRMGFAATLRMKQDNDPRDVKECMQHLFEASNTIIVGGQQRVCSVEQPDQEASLMSMLPQGASITGTHVKWVLLTPSVFPAIPARKMNGKEISQHPGGWLPPWINPLTGKVELLNGPGVEKAKRLKVPQGAQIQAHLVAARIPKPIAITGWSERLHLAQQTEQAAELGVTTEKGARTALLAVPAGAVYYFEAGSAEEANKLAAALNWHGAESNPATIKNRRSTLLGEKGFGLGVCGTWDFDKSSNQEGR